jgi:hypothetical protein
VHGSVQQHDAGNPAAMAGCPSERDRTSPIVSHDDYRAGDFESVGYGLQVIDSLLEPPHLAGTLGKTHIEMVYRNNPDIIWCGRQEAAP